MFSHRLRYTDAAHIVSMTRFVPPPLTSPLDTATLALVRLAAVASGGSEAQLRTAVASATRDAPAVWVEELVLQTYLFAGFPRALNFAREWRRMDGAVGEGERGREGETELTDGTDYSNADQWRSRGEATCAIIYGPSYERLRHNIRALHPALDTWMIVEGYGKVLSRPGLDLARRELCVVAACAHTRQDRQLHSHLHGALHAGAPPESVDATLDAIADVLGEEAEQTARMLWARVRVKHV